MLELEKPITLGSKTYTHLVPRQLFVDLPSRDVQVLFALCTVETGRVHIGTEILDEEKGRVFTLPTHTTPWQCQAMGLVDTPLIQRILNTLKTTLKEIELIIEETQDAEGGFAKIMQQVGEDVFALRVKRVSTEGKPVLARKVYIKSKNPNFPKPLVQLYDENDPNTEVQ